MTIINPNEGELSDAEIDAIFDRHQAAPTMTFRYWVARDVIKADRERRGAAVPVIVWPKSKSVKRRDDMSHSDTLQVGIDESGDLQVSLWTEQGYSSVEFCTGMGGGGRSPHTRLALIALMVAMEADEVGKSLSPTAGAGDQPREPTAILECLDVLRPLVNGKWPAQQALEELGRAALREKA